MIMSIIELNDISYTKLILSIDVKAFYGKIEIRIVRACKNKDFPNGNAETAWGKL
jgi:hypothetical protein